MEKYKIATLEQLSEKAKDDLEWFWESVSQELGIVWHSPYSNILDTTDGIAWSKWFVGGKTNIYSSSVERFAKMTPGRVAYHFESEDGTKTELTYSELDAEVTRLAGGLASLGIKKGDVIAVYMPMIKEALVAILAAAKMGAIQTVIFSGYGSESLHVRLQDCNARLLLVSDGFYRKGKPVSQKGAVEEAVKNTGVETIVVVRYKGVDTYSESPQVKHYDELASRYGVCDTEIVDSNDPLFILYTSGTTGKPKGTVHTHGGFSVFAGYQSVYLVDTCPHDILFWPADIGWITGLVWNVYGLLLAGSSAVIYDGGLDYPERSSRPWSMLQEYTVSIFGLSPTAARMLKKSGVVPVEQFSLEKIKNIPTTGEPLDEETWRWLYEKVGGKRIPIINLSGGTEIGGAMLSVFPGMSLKPSTVGIPIPGMSLDCVDEKNNPVRGTDGYLVVKQPWPAMIRGLLNDDKRYLETYWSRFKDTWFHGDYTRVDEDGLWYMRGRTDDVINVSGHRMGTAEIEHAVMSCVGVGDAACVAIPDAVTGEAIAVFWVTGNGVDKMTDAVVSEHVAKKIGKLARPRHVFEVSDLPRTRTGKVMRRLLKLKLLGKDSDLGDLSSLENPHALDCIPRLD